MSKTVLLGSLGRLLRDSLVAALALANVSSASNSARTARSSIKFRGTEDARAETLSDNHSYSHIPYVTYAIKYAKIVTIQFSHTGSIIEIPVVAVSSRYFLSVTINVRAP